MQPVQQHSQERRRDVGPVNNGARALGARSSIPSGRINKMPLISTTID